MLSSAKLQALDFVTEKNKSFMKILKRREPTIDLCDTPVLISYHELKDKSFRPLFPISKKI